MQPIAIATIFFAAVSSTVPGKWKRDDTIHLTKFSTYSRSPAKLNAVEAILAREHIAHHDQVLAGFDQLLLHELRLRHRCRAIGCRFKGEKNRMHRAQQIQPAAELPSRSKGKDGRFFRSLPGDVARHHTPAREDHQL